MLHFSERRHRIHGDEIDTVKLAVYADLLRRLRERDDLLASCTLFRFWYRMETHCRNKPAYPPHETWSEIEAYLDFGTVTPPPEPIDYGTISTPADSTDNGTVSPSSGSLLDVAVKMGLRMSKEASP